MLIKLEEGKREKWKFRKKEKKEMKKTSKIWTGSKSGLLYVLLLFKKSIVFSLIIAFESFPAAAPRKSKSDSSISAASPRKWLNTDLIASFFTSISFKFDISKCEGRRKEKKH